MASLNSQYGSELHLLRMLGRHRQFFNRKILDATGADGVEWLDFPSGELRKEGKKKKKFKWDREWEHLNFLVDDDAARELWARDWPVERKGPNWDAIGKLRFGDDAFEWLLIEAKANEQELSSSCGAKRSLNRIRVTLGKLKAELGAPPNCDWMNGHYQFCNRLAALDIMNRPGSAARLVFVFFYGDVGDKRRTCPRSPYDWERVIADQDAHVGLPPGHRLEHRIHRLFIDASVR